MNCKHDRLRRTDLGGFTGTWTCDECGEALVEKSHLDRLHREREVLYELAGDEYGYDTVDKILKRRLGETQPNAPHR